MTFIADAFRRFLLSTLLGAGFALPLWAAGGHHAVDDAATLDAGSCQLETWYERIRGGDGLLVAGPACHFGGVDWTLNYERVRPKAEDAFNVFTPEAKVAHAFGSGWAIGGALGASYDDAAGRWESLELRLPVTYFAGDIAAVHAAVARVFERGTDNVWFYGVGTDIALPADFELLLEAWREANEWFGRAGLRWFLPVNGINVDLSYAHSEESDGDRWVSAGLTWEFGRPF